jgi:hypothetical protein
MSEKHLHGTWARSLSEDLGPAHEGGGDGGKGGTWLLWSG